MKALLENGEIRQLLQDDCGCVGIHDGLPHWLYMDGVDRERNRQLLESGSWLGAMGFAKEEAARLREKIGELQRRKIAKLLPETEEEKKRFC